MLKLSRKMLYAIEAVLDIAYHAGTGPVQSSEITRRQGIPKRYLEQGLQHLVKQGLLIGVRGPRGGYRLARERRRIMIGEIVKIIGDVEALEAAKKPSAAMEESNLCKQVLLPVIEQVESDIMARLDQTSIDDLCDQAQKAGVESEGRQNLDFTI